MANPPQERTLALTVHDTAFLLDRLGEDCHPLQFLRELTQNSLEAIQRTGEPGKIIWDVDWNSYEIGDRRVRKLCIVDTGDGMTGEEMVRYINQLSSSLSRPSLEGNYGVGAKIAAATRNHQGLIYLSWKAGRGTMIHLWRDPAGTYGLRQLSRPDGTFGHWAEIGASIKPGAIGEHGTAVILLGMHEDHDTMLSPLGGQTDGAWVAKYLNGRYFRFPAGVTIGAREGFEHPRANTARNRLRSVTGMQPYLADHAKSGGAVDLPGARAHWWILQDSSALAGDAAFTESSGHVAALYQDELYEMQSGRAGRALLQAFGVLMGTKRVVIYLEPRPARGSRITTNTARTQLLIDREPLPWAEYALAFRDHMPEPIQALLEEIASGASRSDHAATIRDRLKPLMDLYRVSRYRRTPEGDLTSRGATVGGEPGPPRGRKPSAAGNGGSGGGGRGGRAGGIYAAFLEHGGERARRLHPDVFPRVQWVSTVDGTRTAGDIEDRAARFLLDQNVLQINADFRVFADLAERIRDELDAPEAVRPMVVDAVHKWFEQALVETVIGVQMLKDAKEWTIADIGDALSEAALTTAVMPRYHVYTAVRRELGTKLGKLSKAKAGSKAKPSRAR